MKAVRLLIVVFYLAFFAWSALATLNLLRVPICDPQWYLHTPPNSYQLIDFSQFYQAGQLSLGKDAHHVYDPEVQNQWACKLVAPHVPDKIFYNQSVPFLYVLLIPFGFLPYNQAYVSWCLVTAVMAGLALLLLVSKAGYLKGKGQAFFIAGSFSSIAAYLTVWHGQTTFLLTAAFALMALALMQKRDWLGGFCLALTTFKPQYLFPFIALAWGLNRRLVIVALFLFEFILMAAAALFIGPQNIFAYPAVLAGAESSSRFIGVNPQIMVSLRGLLSNFLPYKMAMNVTIALLLLCLFPLVWVSRHVMARSADSQSACRWLIAFTFVMALILSPHSHYFDCLLLAVPAALTLPTVDLLDLICQTGEARALHLSHRIWCIVLVFYPVLSWPVNFISREVEAIIFFSINLVLALLAAIMLKHLAGQVAQAAAQTTTV